MKRKDNMQTEYQSRSRGSSPITRGGQQ